LAGCARVSTEEQGTDPKLDELRGGAGPPGGVSSTFRSLIGEATPLPWRKYRLDIGYETAILKRDPDRIKDA
jgi:hypothetical protein